MMLNATPPQSPSRGSPSPSRGTMHRVTATGRIRKSPLGQSDGLSSLSPKTAKRPWRSRFQAKMNPSFLTALSRPHEQSTSFNRLLGAAKHQDPLFKHIAQDGTVMALFAALGASGGRAQTSIATTRAGEVYLDESNAEACTFTPSVGCLIERVALADVRCAKRDKPLEPARMRNILQAINDGKKIPPISVNAHLQVQNGYHRFYASKILEHTHIDVQRAPV